MPSRASASRRSPDRVERVASSTGPAIDSEITWLLHRAAQRLRSATGGQAERHGIALRDYIVLSALHLTPDLTQVELAKTLGFDKTTLMSQLDRLDRRARIPEITEEGQTVRARVARACADVEAAALNDAGPDQQTLFRRMLVDIIGNSQDPGSCL